MNTDKQFSIDFFALMFLSDSVIGSQTIAKSQCFDDFSEIHYHKMNDQQREQFFDYVKKNPNFSLENEQCRHFFARFNPKNQYLVGCFHKGIATKHNLYFYNDKYHSSMQAFASPEYIKSIVRIHDKLVIK